MIDRCHRRVARGEPMPGVFAIAQSVPMGVAVEAVLFIAQASNPGEWEGQVVFLPL
ncbi:MAG: hypothetical protein ACR2HN_10555 [Tepidiformaceae bacterium]